MYGGTVPGGNGGMLGAGGGGAGIPGGRGGSGGTEAWCSNEQRKRINAQGTKPIGLTVLRLIEQLNSVNLRKSARNQTRGDAETTSAGESNAYNTYDHNELAIGAIKIARKLNRTSRGTNHLSLRCEDTTKAIPTESHRWRRGQGGRSWSRGDRCRRG